MSQRYNHVSSALRSMSHLELAVSLPGQVSHAGGLQIDQPAGDLLVPLLLQVAQHATLHEHLQSTTGGSVTHHLHLTGSVLSALTLLAPTMTLLRSTSSSVSSSSTACNTQRKKKAVGMSVKSEAGVGEALRPEPDLSLIVADKHGGVALHDGRRQSLEVAPEVAEGHVLRVTCTEQAEGNVSLLGQCNISHSDGTEEAAALQGMNTLCFLCVFLSLARSNLHCLP